MIAPKALQRPLVLGHRGASAHAADNTTVAFETAVAHGADGVELDVRRTADWAMVLNHDPEVGEMGPLVHHDFATIRRTNPEIPTLDEALAVLGDLIINIELKNSPAEADYDPSHEIADVLARWVTQHDIANRVVVTSFNPDTVAAVRLAFADITTGQLVYPGFDIAHGVEAIAAAGHSWIAPYVSDVTADPTGAVEAAHAAGLRTAVWTVDDHDDVRTLHEAAVDAIITNDPRATLAVLEAGG